VPWYSILPERRTSNNFHSPLPTLPPAAPLFGTYQAYLSTSASVSKTPTPSRPSPVQSELIVHRDTRNEPLTFPGTIERQLLLFAFASGSIALVPSPPPRHRVISRSRVYRSLDAPEQRTSTSARAPLHPTPTRSSHKTLYPPARALNALCLPVLLFYLSISRGAALCCCPPPSLNDSYLVSPVSLSVSPGLRFRSVPLCQNIF